jgi:serine/threonine-protein kinase
LPTTASDIYSLGITLFTLLTGQRPFEGRTLEELVMQRNAMPLPMIMEFCPDLPIEIASCLDRLTADNPLERPANGMAAALLIESVLGKTRDMEMLMHEAFHMQHQVKWSPHEQGYQIVMQLANGRTQKVNIAAKDTLQHQAVVQIYSICCPSNPTYYPAALKLNSELAHGGIGLIEHDGVSHFILQNTYPRGTVDPEEIRESVMEIAMHADRIEKLLTGQDEN